MYTYKPYIYGRDNTFYVQIGLNMDSHHFRSRGVFLPASWQTLHVMGVFAHGSNHHSYIPCQQQLMSLFYAHVAGGLFTYWALKTSFVYNGNILISWRMLKKKIHSVEGKLNQSDQAKIHIIMAPSKNANAITTVLPAVLTLYRLITLFLTESWLS